MKRETKKKTIQLAPKRRNKHWKTNIEIIKRQPNVYEIAEFPLFSCVVSSPYVLLRFVSYKSIPFNFRKDNRLPNLVHGIQLLQALTFF